MKRPWRPHYTKDWRTDPFVRSLSLEVRAIYLELIDIEWDEDGLDPVWLVSPFSFLCGAIGCHWRTFAAAWTILEPKYSLQDGLKMRSRRVQEELRIASERSEASAKAANKRWHGDADALPSHHIHNTAHNSTEEKKPTAPAAPEFDLEAIYAEYPRKVGKAGGIKALKRQIKTAADHAKAMQGAIAFAVAMKSEGRPVDKIPYFSSWANQEQWRDYADLPQGQLTLGGAANKRGFRAPMEHQSETKDETHDL